MKCEQINVGDKIAKRNGGGYCKDPDGTEYLVEAVDRKVDLDLFFFEHKRGDSKKDLIKYYPDADLSALRDDVLYIIHYQYHEDTNLGKWEVVSKGKVAGKNASKSMEPLDKSSLTEQQRKDREFFFKDLVKPYKAPEANGQRIGFEFL